jgi:hypothetical protein
MSSKTQSYILAAIITVIAGVGMMSTGMAALATTNDRYQDSQSSYGNANINNNDNSNVNNNTVYVGSQAQSQHIAQIPQYQQPYYPPAPTYTPPIYEYYEAPGIPNTGLGGLAGINLVILMISGLFVAAGIAYLFPWSKQNVKYS